MPPSRNDPCQRGCCWTPYSCATQGDCDCHPLNTRNWLNLPTEESPVRLDHRDPTPDEALRNIMRERRKK